ncbi:hypothetical protein H9P43_001504 [Blastocladiella emersonii ATCC 22665]|nr:hypothetical protein H9P43_001504 [Blastocladiella emersonii ATCC 22665]
MSSEEPTKLDASSSTPDEAPSSVTPTPCSGAADCDIEDLAKPIYPTVPFYGPCIVRDLKPGETKRWCTCGLSKKQPWCDASHRGTPFKPLVWKVPERQQSLFAICNCKYTKAPPYCDATHTSCPLEIYKRQKACQSDHSPTVKLCSDCGWTPDTVLIDL